MTLKVVPIPTPSNENLDNTVVLAGTVTLNVYVSGMELPVLFTMKNPRVQKGEEWPDPVLEIYSWFHDADAEPTFDYHYGTATKHGIYSFSKDRVTLISLNFEKNS